MIAGDSLAGPAPLNLEHSKLVSYQLVYPQVISAQSGDHINSSMNSRAI
jgi:hypothetical protein